MLISVIVPVYKIENYIRRCVDSILEQSFEEYELLLVDDGSPDRCGSICDEYAGKNSHVFVLHKANGGLSDARNAGIDWAMEHSDSKWITFVDSDDWVHRDYLKSLYEAAIRLKEDISICGFQRVADGEEPATDLMEKQDDRTGEVRRWKSEDFFVERNVNAVVAWGKLYKKELWKDVRYPRGKIHEDEFTTYRLLFQREQVAVVRRNLYFYYQNQQGIMNVAWSPARLDVLEAMKERAWFFAQQEKYRRAYEWNINAMLRSCYWNYLLALRNRELEDQKKYLRKIKREYLNIIRNYHRCGFLKKDETGYEYHAMFPVRSFFYEYGSAIKRKIHRREEHAY